MMILRTRKEQYLNEIVGNGNTAPGIPYTREELFFADILGEVNAPVPLTRIEIYLAKIANKYSGELPEPKTRIEKFIARAAGMNVIIPTPITREEMLWANYALITERELNGIPPLTFNSIAGTLKNYRIYGNTVDGESVGNLVTDSHSEHYNKYAIPVTTNSETANIFLDEPLRMVGDEAEYIDYGEQKQHRVRKNLLKNTATSQTINGVTFTGNSDGSITCNGTASDNVLVNIIPSTFSLPEGAYILNGAPPGGGQSYNFKLDVRVSTRIYYPDIGNGIQFNILQNEKITMCRIAIYSGYTCDNLTFYPMLRKADITDDTYEPYIENTDLDVTLPALPVLPGTNTLTVGTEVQPSNVYIKYEGAR